MSNTYAIYLPSLEQMQQNVDKITFIMHKDDLKMKEEDLKVGMVFVSTNYKEEIYIKITNIDDKNISYMIFYNSKFMGNFINKNILPIKCFIESNELQKTKLIDKVPAKIEEVEEEIPIFIEKDEYDKLKDENFYCAYVKNFNSSFDNRTELCKIKRKVKKELNFSWEKNLWE